MEADPLPFQQTIDKFPALFSSEDWKLIARKAETSLEKRDYAKSALYSTKARILAEKLQDNLQIARSYHQAGRIQTKILDYSKAKEYFGQAALFYAKTERNPQNKLEAAFLLKDLAIIYSNPDFINKTQDLNTAVFYLSQAYKAATTSSDPRAKNLLIQTSLQIATCFGIRGDFPAQIVWLEKVQTLISKDTHENSPYHFDALLGLQSAYRALGSYEDAYQNIEKLESWLKRNPDSHKRLRYLRHLSDFYTQINYPRERDNALSEGIALSKKLNIPDMLGDFYSAKLLKSLEDRNLKESAGYLSLLEDLSGKNSFSVNKLDIQVARAVLAGYANDQVKSDEYFRLAGNTLEETGGEWTNTLFLLVWESRIASYRRDYEKLKRISEKYLESASRAGSLDSLPQIYIFLAGSYAGAGDLANARKYNKLAIDLSESRRLSNSAQISTGVVEGLYEAYRQLISYNLSEKKHDDALLASELLKARWLNDKISNSPLNKKTVIDEKTKPEIFNLSLALIEKPDDAGAAVKLSESQRAALSYESKSDDSPVSKVNKNLLADLNNSPINEGAAVISYAFTDGSKLVAFTWQKGKPINAVPLDLTLEEVDKIAFETSQKIKDFIFFKQDGKSVFDKLIKPLNLPTDVKHLIIIPDKSLWRIPFQALSPDGRTYLIENKMVSYAPSVSVLLNQLNNPEPERRSFQVFANSLYKNFYLKFADAEARALAAGFNVKPTLNAQITDFSSNSDRSDIIHFSMHAEVERNAPFNSFLAFKPAGQTDDGRLSVEELLQMRLKKGSLVFLASCDTTNVFNGEGLVSLAWGMFGAGASTVISAQWEADDQSTSLFARNFYQNFRRGISSSEALQQASVELIRDKTGNQSEPYFWAQFTLSGDYR